MKKWSPLNNRTDSYFAPYLHRAFYYRIKLLIIRINFEMLSSPSLGQRKYEVLLSYQ